MGWIEGNFRVNKDLIEGDRGWSRTKPSEIKQKTLEIKHIIRKFSNFWHFIILDDRSNLRNTFNFHSFSKFLLFQLFGMTKQESYLKFRLRLISIFTKKTDFVREHVRDELTWWFKSPLNSHTTIRNMSLRTYPTWTYSHCFGVHLRQNYPKWKRMVFYKQILLCCSSCLVLLENYNSLMTTPVTVCSCRVFKISYFRDYKFVIDE